MPGPLYSDDWPTNDWVTAGRGTGPIPIFTDLEDDLPFSRPGYPADREEPLWDVEPVQQRPGATGPNGQIANGQIANGQVPTGQYELVVVANRLPVDHHEEPDGSSTWTTTSDS